MAIRSHSLCKRNPATGSIEFNSLDSYVNHEDAFKTICSRCPFALTRPGKPDHVFYFGLCDSVTARLGPMIRPSANGHTGKHDCNFLSLVTQNNFLWQFCVLQNVSQPGLARSNPK